MKTFQFKNHNKCTFCVSHYLANNKAIAIIIQDSITSEVVCKCTTYDIHFNYKIGVATIKNYSENKRMTYFLKKLGIVEKVIDSYKCNELADDTETIDVCKINSENLKTYAVEWHYAEGEEF